MLAYCLEDGLTCNKTVYRRGDIFVLPIQMEGDYGGLNPSQLASKQRQIYGRQMFSFPSAEEVMAAYKAKTIPTEWLSKSELHLVSVQKIDEGQRIQEAAETLKEKLEEENPELKKDEEEDATAVAPPQIEHVPGVTETPPKSNKASSAKKATRQSSTKRKTK
jgi:hypothetical protein